MDERRNAYNILVGKLGETKLGTGKDFVATGHGFK
jgi:hypothetical protein